MSGWIKLHRKIRKSNLYKNLNSKQRDVMIQCLMAANHEDNEWEWQGQVHKCQPGQFITSLDSLAKECASDVKVQSVRTALLKLEKWGFLTNESTKTGRLITIINWHTYQLEEDITSRDINKQPTKRQQSVNKALTTNKNDKNEKNDKEEKTITLESVDSSVWDYEDLWLYNLIKEEVIFTSPQKIKLHDYSWWHDVHEVLSGFDPDFIKKQFAEMRIWKKDNGNRWPTDRGIRKFVKSWLVRAKEFERRRR